MTGKAISLDELNPPQREAVEYGVGPLLVLAGAGSGKTRVITYRIANLISQHNIAPNAIMAVTFTNKAAGEMRDRVKQILGSSMAKQIWIGTFHALCLRILKKEVPHEFTIYDDEESKRLIKECQRELNIDEKMLKADILRYRIGSAKNELIGPEEFEKVAVDFTSLQVAKVYHLYQKKLVRNKAYDFGDLIMSTVRLLQEKPELHDKYRDQFQFILVDEYQDINHCQYFWIRQLAGEEGNLTVVGDDDQSIYQFRGADLRNILEFERDYPKAKAIKLEQNYRSTQNILAAASAVVKNNSGRKEKTLWTENGSGLPLQYFRGETEAEESSFIVKEILHDVYDKKIRRLTECVILYRTNAQSRPLEDALRRERIPYRIVGGMKFYDRMEVKDVLAYLKVMMNPSDELSLDRIVNTPPRGLGTGALSKVREIASEQGLTMLEAMAKIAQDGEGLTDRARQAVTAFSNMMQGLKAQVNQIELTRFIATLITETGYLAMWQNAPHEEGASRVENLNELIEAADEFSRTGDNTLEGFLDQIALVSSWDEADSKNSDQVTLMTLHSSKGLEFPLVFMVGLEEGLFPHSNALQDEHGLAEERRLCYVGITRARERLILTGTATRSSFGNRIYNSESRFLHEIPGHLFVGQMPICHQKAEKTEDSRGLWRDKNYESSHEAVSNEPFIDDICQEVAEEAGLLVGQRVSHAKYGSGTIIGKQGEGEDLKFEIAFTRHGRKQMLARFAALQPSGGKIKT
jgi:ATP-dependent DNA helicase UvrD/PcrA